MMCEAAPTPPDANYTSDPSPDRKSTGKRSAQTYTRQPTVQSSKTLMYITKSESKKNRQTRSEDTQPYPIDRKAEIPPTLPKQGRAPFPPKEQFPPAQFPRAASNWLDKPSLQIPPKGLYCHYRKGELSKKPKRRSGRICILIHDLIYIKHIRPPFLLRLL